MYRLCVAEARLAAQEAEEARAAAQDETARAEVCFEAYGRDPLELAKRARRRANQWVLRQRSDKSFMQDLAPLCNVDAIPTEGGFRVVEKLKHKGPQFISSFHASTARAFYRGGGELDEQRSKPLRKAYEKILSKSLDLPPAPLDEAPSRHIVHHSFRDRDAEKDVAGLWKASPPSEIEPAISQFSPRKHPSHFFKSDLRPEGAPFSTSVDFNLYSRPGATNAYERRVIPGSDRRRLCRRLSSSQRSDLTSSTSDLPRSTSSMSLHQSEFSGLLQVHDNQSQQRMEEARNIPRPSTSQSILRRSSSSLQAPFSSSFPRRRLSELEVRPRTSPTPLSAQRDRKYSVTIRSLDLPSSR